MRWMRQHNLHIGTVRHGLEMTRGFQPRGAGTVIWCFLFRRFSRERCRFAEWWDCCGQLAATACIMGEPPDCRWHTRRFLEQTKVQPWEVIRNGMRTSRAWHKRSWSRTDFARSACESRTLEVGGWCADRVFGPCWSQTKIGKSTRLLRDEPLPRGEEDRHAIGLFKFKSTWHAPRIPPDGLHQCSSCVCVVISSDAQCARGRRGPIRHGDEKNLLHVPSCVQTCTIGCWCVRSLAREWVQQVGIVSYVGSCWQLQLSCFDTVDGFYFLSV